MTSEGGLVAIFRFDRKLSVSRIRIQDCQYLGSSEQIDKLVHTRDRLRVLHDNLVQFPVIDTKLE